MLRRQQVLFPRHFDDRIEEALRQSSFTSRSRRREKFD